MAEKVKPRRIRGILHWSSWPTGYGTVHSLNCTLWNILQQEFCSFCGFGERSSCSYFPSDMFHKEVKVDKRCYNFCFWWPTATSNFSNKAIATGYSSSTVILMVICYHLQILTKQQSGYNVDFLEILLILLWPAEQTSFFQFNSNIKVQSNLW